MHRVPIVYRRYMHANKTYAQFLENPWDWHFSGREDEHFGVNEEEKYDFFWLRDAELRNFAKRKYFGYKYTTFVSDNLLPTSIYLSVGQYIIICSAIYFQTNDKKGKLKSLEWIKWRILRKVCCRVLRWSLILEPALWVCFRILYQLFALRQKHLRSWWFSPDCSDDCS